MSDVSIVVLPSLEYTCTLNSCKNGGSCMEGKCVCPEGYFGENCEGIFCLYIVLNILIKKDDEMIVNYENDKNKNIIKIRYYIESLIPE